MSHQYLNSIFSHGFIQTVSKCTRMQNQSKTLLDHIITNSHNSNFTTGTLLSDISDHFPTFILNSKVRNHAEQKHVNARIFSRANLAKFKTKLSEKNWDTLLCVNNVDAAYDEFWSSYTHFYEECFPTQRIKFNRNMHKCNEFMSAGLLVSRVNKLNLHKACILDPSPLNITAYKNFRTVFQKTVCAAKKTSHYYKPPK